MDYAYGSPIESYISDPQPGPQNPAFMPGLYHMRAESSSSGSSNSSLSPQISPLISQNNALGLHANYGQWSDFSFESEVKRSNQIASASHQDLLEARNAPYTQLHQSYTTLQIQFKTLKESFHTLSTSLQGSGPPACTSTHFSLPIGPTALLERNDHPKVRFWTRDDFNKVGGKKKTTSINSERPRRGNTRMTQDINVMFTFLEQADGTILSGKEAQAVRRHATTALLEIHTNYPDLVPATWGVAPLSIVNYVRSELYAAYPCLRLCVGHWKCDLLLTTIYTNWYKSRKKTSTPRSDGCQCPCSCAAAKVEDEISDPEQDDDVAVDVHSRIGQKRKSSSKSSFTPSTLAKRQRLSPSDSPALLATPDTDPILPLAPTSSPSTLPLAASPICSVSPPDTSSTSASSSTTPSPPPSVASHAPRTPSLTVSTPSAATSITSPITSTTSPTMPTTSAGLTTPTAPTTLQPVVILSITETGEPSAHTSLTSPATPPNSLVADQRPVAPFIINPLDAEFGIASGPTGRLANLEEQSRKAEVKAAMKPKAKGKKRPSDSTTAANLFYRDYLKSNSAVTSEEFEIIFSALPADVLKIWTDKSRALGEAKKLAKKQAVNAANVSVCVSHCFPDVL
ncbi:hypothetical protein C8J57DRAFT_1647316 [Mycena rebaudengoi]|nr:hypothetical protein C8J57DRAFT_1647316 [Mycena rebaudengoi]